MEALTAISETMTSLEISELTGKRHDHVMRDIHNMLNALKLDELNFKRTYIDSSNRTQKCFLLSKNLNDIILDKYKGLNRVPHRLREESSLRTIEQILNVKLVRQYRVLKYKVDGYDLENNIVYEVYEEEHKYTVKKDKKRQDQITKVLNCKFITIKL